MSGLSCFLIVIFVLTITSLVALYFFVSRHQRRFKRQSHLATATDHESTTTTTDSAYYVPSKELLYFFWWNNNQSREGPTAQTTDPEPRPDPSAPSDIDLDVIKLIAALQGHARSPLFTVIEEETTAETTDESPNKVHKNDNRTSLSSSEGDIIGRVSLAGSFGAGADGSPAGDVADPVTSSDDDEVEEDETMTPNFTTPNASPPYLTPSDSPLHEYGNMDSTFHIHNFTANSRGRLGFRRPRRPRAEVKAKEDGSKVAPVSEESEGQRREEGGASE